MTDITKLALEWYYAGKYPYCYGTFGQKWTEALRAEKRKQYPAEYARIQSLGKYAVPSPYKAVFDCIGFLRALCLYHATKNPLGNIRYFDYGKPGGCKFMDISANGAWRAWGGTNPISTIPEPTPDKPVAVFMKNSKGVVSHVGLYVGRINGVPTTLDSTPPQLRMAALAGRSWCGWAYVPQKWLTWADNYFNGNNAPAQEKPVTGRVGGLREGDCVRIKAGTTHYWPCGPKMPSEAEKWFWDKTFTVRQITLKSGADNIKGGVACVLLGGVNTWCDPANLEKAED